MSTTLLHAPPLGCSKTAEHTSHPVVAGSSVAPDDFAELRRELILKFCKWDPQVGDVSTIADFPLLIRQSTWNELASVAVQLTAELLAAEQELGRRRDLYRRLAIPRALRSVLGESEERSPTPTAVRAMRFDFHWTREGWRISEVNSDVPGGYSEASELTRLMSEANGASPVGNPAQQWADRICATVQQQPVAFLTAPGFMEDHQVVSYLARVLNGRGIQTELAGPQQLRWESGRAFLRRQELGAVVRFYQAEWLSRLPTRSGWRQLLVGGRTPVSNPATSVFGESKRFPLVWNELGASLQTWRKYLPETHSPRDAPWQRDDTWLLKSAWCNTGDSVSARDICTPKQWRHAWRSAKLWPNHWVAQRRFEPIAVPTPMGDVYPCIGVFTIDGRVSGAYTRISTRMVVDHRAIDAALLVTGAPK